MESIIPVAERLWLMQTIYIYIHIYIYIYIYKCVCVCVCVYGRFQGGGGVITP